MSLKFARADIDDIKKRGAGCPTPSSPTFMIIFPSTLRARPRIWLSPDLTSIL